MSDGQGSITYSSRGSSSGGSLPGVTVPLVAFVVGDGQAGTPVTGQSSLKVATIQGQSLVNKELLVQREGISLLWNTAANVNDLRRFNSGGLGGWTFEGGITFQPGERWQIYITGINQTIQT